MPKGCNSCGCRHCVGSMGEKCKICLKIVRLNANREQICKRNGICSNECKSRYMAIIEPVREHNKKTIKSFIQLYASLLLCVKKKECVIPIEIMLIIRNYVISNMIIIDIRSIRHFDLNTQQNKYSIPLLIKYQRTHTRIHLNFFTIN